MSTFELNQNLTVKFHQRYQIDVDSGCWLWTSTVLSSGHPFISVDKNGKKANAFAAQIAYELKNGKPNERIKLGRTCNNLLCVNPDHIFKIQNKKKMGITQSPNLCIVKDCGRMRVHKESEMCNGHHRMLLNTGDVKAIQKVVRHTGTLEERFNQKYEIDSVLGCWIWKAHRQADGYGTIQNGRQSLLAHRVSYMLYRGSIPDGALILHSCDNPPCVNPLHLFVGTDQLNATDKMVKGRNLHVGGKSKLTIEDVITIRQSTLSIQELAEQFGLRTISIKNIKIGKTFNNVLDDGQVLEPEARRYHLNWVSVILIRKSSLTNKRLSLMFDVDETTISDAKLGKSWIHINDFMIKDIESGLQDNSAKLRRYCDVLSHEDFQLLVNSTVDPFDIIPVYQVG